MSYFAFLLIILILPTALGALLPSGLADNIHGDVLLSGERLTTNQFLRNGFLILLMQEDCNLVLRDNGDAVWSSQTNDKGTNCYLLMQNDGNLVVYDGNGNGLWGIATESLGWSLYACVLNKDRRAVMIFGGFQWGFSF